LARGTTYPSLPRHTWLTSPTALALGGLLWLLAPSAKCHHQPCQRILLFMCRAAVPLLGAGMLAPWLPPTWSCRRTHGAVQAWTCPPAAAGIPLPPLTTAPPPAAPSPFPPRQSFGCHWPGIWPGLALARARTGPAGKFGVMSRSHSCRDRHGSGISSASTSLSLPPSAALSATSRPSPRIALSSGGSPWTHHLPQAPATLPHPQPPAHACSPPHRPLLRLCHIAPPPPRPLHRGHCPVRAMNNDAGPAPPTVACPHRRSLMVRGAHSSRPALV